MTVLLGGSVLLIAASAAALVFGWLNGEDTFIWGSIGATAAAAILIIVAYVRSNKEPVPTEVTHPNPDGPGNEETTKMESPPAAAPTQPPADEGAPTQPVADAPTKPPADEGAETAAMPAAGTDTTADDDKKR